MKNILHTNPPAVRHEQARGDSYCLTADQLTTNDTPTPVSHPTIMNTTITARLARHAFSCVSNVLVWGHIFNDFNRGDLFLKGRKTEWHKLLQLYRKVIHMVDFYEFFIFIFSLPGTNYRHLAVEKINQRIISHHSNLCKIIHSKMVNDEVASIYHSPFPHFRLTVISFCPSLSPSVFLTFNVFLPSVATPGFVLGPLCVLSGLADRGFPLTSTPRVCSRSLQWFNAR